MQARHLVVLAVAASAGAVFAQNTDLNASARQARMDQALARYEHQHGDAASTTSGDAAATASSGHRSMGSDMRQFGHSFMHDVKKAPHRMAQAGRETGHRVAEAAREQGHEMKGAAHKAKEGVTGK